MTSTTAAQDEFNELMRDKDRNTTHPEDRHAHNSDLSEPESDGAAAAADYLETADTDDELEIPPNMRSNYYMPSLRSEANTGPKGVIADAQAFELARKQARRFTWKKNNAASAGYNSQYAVTAKAWHEKEPLSDEDSDSEFMKTWRANRLKELGNKIRSRTNSPTRRIYGTFEEVTPEEYLDAIDRPPSISTVIVVFVFNNNKNRKTGINREIEECMGEVAKRNDTIRFVKFDNAEAELKEAGVPAVLAYRGGNMFSSVVPIAAELPMDSEVSAVSLETILRRHRII